MHMKITVCPKCKSNNVIPIMYGYPAPETFEVTKKAGTGETAVGSFALSVVGMVIKKK